MRRLSDGDCLMSATTTVVHVLRHGEVHNPEKILYGRRPGFRLSDLGVQMAKAAALALAEHDITHILSSPLERALQTAEPIAEQFSLSVATDDQLLETINLFEGKKFAAGEGVFRHPGSWWLLRNPFRPSWGEPYRDVAARMFAALLAARDAGRGHESVIVSHQLPIEILRRYVCKEKLWHDPRRRQCSLASLTAFHFTDNDITDVTYQEPAAHLVAMSPTARNATGA